MNFNSFRVAYGIVNKLGLTSFWTYTCISIYYVVTIINALLEGVGLVIVVDIFTGKALDGNYHSPVVGFIDKYLSSYAINFDLNLMLLIVCALFFARIITYLSILVSEGYFHAVIRRSIQSFIFQNYILGKWEFVRNVRVGHAVNTINLESMHLEKYYFSLFKGFYFLMSSSILIFIAFIIDFKITVILGLISLPFIISLYFLLKIQTRLSEKFANLRNIFGADISERISGSMQIQVEGSQKYHIETGLKTQPSMQRLEILIGICQAALSLFAIFLPFIIFLIILVISLLTNIDINLFLASLAIIGVIGLRAITQINGLISSIGQISRFEGSLIVINDALKIPNIKTRKKIDQKINKIRCTNLTYKYEGNKVLKSLNFTIKRDETFILHGRSGSGKTTLANLISGIIDPAEGKVEYFSDNESYDSASYRANIGYVMQDIHTFQGSVRENLVNDNSVIDEEIWGILSQVQADDFIREIGGLDAELLEAGRSLSGGQRRRLGIARALLAKADILILDEITSGLDEANVEAIKKLIIDLSKEKIVIMISHDSISIDKSFTYNL
tara:strand:+ start:1648 stop:3327 length:1680 start_codon:yes stop_codon:yes gene_type:complete